MNRQSVEILNAVVNNNILSGQFDRRLVIIENRVGTYCGNSPGPYVSVMDLTSGDFLEIYRYKKSLEENKGKKGDN